MATTRLSKPRASALAAALDLDLDAAGVCHACLSFVSLAMDYGDERDVARELRRMTPDLWGDGLDEPALAAVRRAAERGVPDAVVALDELAQRGGQSAVARELVCRLAAELSARSRAVLRARELAQDRLPLASPELN